MMTMCRTFGTTGIRNKCIFALPSWQGDFYTKDRRGLPSPVFYLEMLLFLFSQDEYNNAGNQQQRCHNGHHDADG
jgi:hypothetical protein